MIQPMSLLGLLTEASMRDTNMSMSEGFATGAWVKGCLQNLSEEWFMRWFLLVLSLKSPTPAWMKTPKSCTIVATHPATNIPPPVYLAPSRLSASRVIKISGEDWLLLRGGKVDILIITGDLAVLVFCLFQYDNCRPPYHCFMMVNSNLLTPGVATPQHCSAMGKLLYVLFLY